MDFSGLMDLSRVNMILPKLKLPLNDVGFSPQMANVNLRLSILTLQPSILMLCFSILGL